MPSQQPVGGKTQALDRGSNGSSSWLLESFAPSHFVTEPWPQSSALRSGLDHLLCRAVLAVPGIRGLWGRTGLWSQAVWTLPESKLSTVCNGPDNGSSLLPRLLSVPAHTEAKILLLGHPPTVFAASQGPRRGVGWGGQSRGVVSCVGWEGSPVVPRLGSSWSPEWGSRQLMITNFPSNYGNNNNHEGSFAFNAGVHDMSFCRSHRVVR